MLFMNCSLNEIGNVTIYVLFLYNANVQTMWSLVKVHFETSKNVSYNEVVMSRDLNICVHYTSIVENKYSICEKEDVDNS